eukprot:334033-Rhodomonas_salina.3
MESLLWLGLSAGAGKEKRGTEGDKEQRGSTEDVILVVSTNHPSQNISTTLPKRSPTLSHLRTTLPSLLCLILLGGA